MANPWHADSAGQNVVYICIHVNIIYQYIYIYNVIYTVQVVSKKIRCATKNTGEVLERSRPIDHCFGCHWVLLHRVPPMAMSKPAPSEAKRHVRICPAQPILTLAVHAGGFCKKLPSYLFKQRWVRGLIKLYRIEVDK